MGGGGGIGEGGGGDVSKDRDACWEVETGTWGEAPMWSSVRT